MKIQITLEGDSIPTILEDVNQLAKALQGVELRPPQGVYEPEATPPTPAQAEPKAKKSTKSKKEAEPSQESPSVTSPTNGSATISRDELTQALAQVNSKKGFQTARKVLAQFGAQRISEIQPEAQGQFLKACKEASL